MTAFLPLNRPQLVTLLVIVFAIILILCFGCKKEKEIDNKEYCWECIVTYSPHLLNYYEYVQCDMTQTQIDSVETSWIETFMHDGVKVTSECSCSKLE